MGDGDQEPRWLRLAVEVTALLVGLVSLLTMLLQACARL